MMLPDVNVLIYAFRPDASHHAASYRWLTDLAQSGIEFGVSKLALSAVVRITTNPRLHRVPSTRLEAFAFCDAILAQPRCRAIEAGPRHWDIFRRLCDETDTVGAGTSDAWYAALAIEHDCEWVTYDRDFARFPELRWRTP